MLPPLGLICIAALAAVAAVRLPRSPTTEAAGVFLLCSPGVAVVEFLRLKRGAIEKALYAAGSSIAIIILSGLVLNLTRWGVSRDGFVVGLAGITVLVCIGAFFRPLAPGLASIRPSPIRIRRSAVALLLIASGIVAAAFVVAIRTAGTIRAPGFTQFGAGPVAASPKLVRITVISREHERKLYEIRLGAGTAARSLASLSLAPGQKWSRALHIPATCNSTRTTALTLYESGSSSPYRQLSLAGSGSQAGPAGACTSTGNAP